MLFTFSDEYIAAACGGLTDDDTLCIFQTALDAGADEVVQSVCSVTGTEPDLEWNEDGLVININQEQADAEFGTDVVEPQPRFRKGVTSAIPDATRAIEGVLNADD